MNLLQKQLDDYIFNWQPFGVTKFAINLDHTASDVLEVAKNNEYIVDVCNEYDGELQMWFELDDSLLLHQFEKRKELWELERKREREEYQRMVI